MSFFFGTAEGIRTPDLLIRSQTLYPTELQPHVIERTVFVLLADGLIILAQVGTECKRKIKISPKIFFGRERTGSSGALSLCNNALQAGHQIRHGLQLDIHLQNVLPELGWHGVKLCTDSGIDIGHGNHLAEEIKTRSGTGAREFLVCPPQRGVCHPAGVQWFWVFEKRGKRGGVLIDCSGILTISILTGLSPK